jgi:hypothetical protein
MEIADNCISVCDIMTTSHMQDGKVTKHVMASGPKGKPVEFWLLDGNDVVRGLVGDERFKGAFHMKPEIHYNAEGDRVYGEPHTCEAFREHAARIGPGIVPISLVLYVDGTSTMTNISLKPIYGIPCDSQCSTHVISS